MKKDTQYLIDQISISAEHSERMVHIHNDHNFDELMRHLPRSGVRELVKQIKETHKTMFEKEINISNKSFEVEIWGHYYFEKKFTVVKGLFRKLNLMRLKGRLVRATEVFDCGESPEDKNRWLWDILSCIHPLITLLIRDKKPR